MQAGRDSDFSRRDLLSLIGTVGAGNWSVSSFQRIFRICSRMNSSKLCANAGERADSERLQQGNHHDRCAAAGGWGQRNGAAAVLGLRCLEFQPRLSLLEAALNAEAASRHVYVALAQAPD